MVKILPVNKKIAKKISKFGLGRKWEKQLELLEPKSMGIYSFRIDLKFRALLFFRDKQTIEILNITAHYH